MLFIFLTIAALGLSFWAQFKVKSNFQKYSDVEASSQRTGRKRQDGFLILTVYMMCR
ncbi:Putative membrane protease YugP [Bacillus licheniformis]|nr:Putative membrane protease YugP [Bacillus licheniformis]